MVKIETRYRSFGPNGFHPSMLYIAEIQHPIFGLIIPDDIPSRIVHYDGYDWTINEFHYDGKIEIVRKEIYQCEGCKEDVKFTRLIRKVL